MNKFLEQRRIHGLIKKTVRDGVANRKPAAENGIVIVFDDTLGQQHLDERR